MSRLLRDMFRILSLMSVVTGVFSIILAWTKPCVGGIQKGNRVMLRRCAMESVLIFAPWWTKRLPVTLVKDKWSMRWMAFMAVLTNQETQTKQNEREKKKVKPFLGDRDSSSEQCTSLNTQHKPCGLHWLLVSSSASVCFIPHSLPWKKQNWARARSTDDCFCIFSLFLTVDLNVGWLWVVKVGHIGWGRQKRADTKYAILASSAP